MSESNVVSGPWDKTKVRREYGLLKMIVRFCVVALMIYAGMVMSVAFVLAINVATDLM